MKILFICRANVGRSQMAEAIFNNISKKHLAISAGLNPPKEWEGKTLSKTRYVAPCMREIGMNVDDKASKRLIEFMLIGIDRVVVIGEKNNWPIFLNNFDKLVYWDISDPDVGGMDLHRVIRDQVKEAVGKLVEEIS